MTAEISGEHPVFTALVRNEAAIGRIIATGMTSELPSFPTQELPVPISFEDEGIGVELTHMQAMAYILGDQHAEAWIRNLEEDESVTAYPTISICLLESTVAMSGIVAQVGFNEFPIPKRRFAHCTPDISAQLTPLTFSVERGITFCDDNEILGDEQLMPVGGVNDSGKLAVVTAQAIDAAALVFGKFSQEKLIEMVRS